MVPALIKYFNVVAVAPDAILLDAVEVNKYAMKCGFIVHPKACTSDAVLFLKSQQANLNITFYKNWGTVENLSEFEMHILQIMHYLSTYGTDFEEPAFTMNDVPEEMQFSNFKLLMPCTDIELFNRIYDMLKSGIALADDSIKLFVDQLSIYYKTYGWKANIDDVLNRQAMALLCALYGELPKSPDKLMRYLFYSATGESLIIKNKKTFNTISESKSTEHLLIIRQLDRQRKRGLATLFYRYKPIFLALRKNAQRQNCEIAVQVINEIRRLARSLHKPFIPGILESLLSPEHTADEVNKAVSGESNIFKLIKLYNYIKSIERPNRIGVYIIRNGKVYVKPISNKPVNNEKLVDITLCVKHRIVSLLSSKSITSDGRPMTVKFPDNMELAAPISEKQFVGNIPYGSSYKLLTNNLIGIYWRNEWGTHDFDLWMIDSNGRRLGWANEHKSDEVLFSGDMTDANPEATEIFYGNENWPDSTIRVSRYYGDQGSKFRLFFASDKLTELPLNYMVNPDSIHFQEDITSEKREQVVGIIYGGKVYFTSISTGNGRLPMYDSPISYEKAFGEKFSSFLSLREIMLEAGFIEYNSNVQDMPAVPDIDLNNMSKDSIIALFGKQ